MLHAVASCSSTTRSCSHAPASQAGGSGRFLRTQSASPLRLFETLFPHCSNHFSHARYSLSHFASSSDLFSADGPGIGACPCAPTGAALTARADTRTSVAIAVFMSPPEFRRRCDQLSVASLIQNLVTAAMLRLPCDG